MPQTTFHTTYSNNQYLFLRANNGSECGLRGTESYRFGFNGQEMDNEITGQTGTHTTAMFWEYDTRLGRRWNVDPVTYPNHSSYLCFNGNPILFTDPFGLYGTKRKAEKQRRKAEEEGLITSPVIYRDKEYSFNAWKKESSEYPVSFSKGKKNFSKEYDETIDKFIRMDVHIKVE